MAKPRANDIFIEALVESLVDGKTIARPSLLVMPDQKGVIEIGEKDGSAMMTNGVRLEIAVHPYTAEEAAAARRIATTSPRNVASDSCQVDSVAMAQALAALQPAGVSTKTLSREGTTVQMTGRAQSNAGISAFMRRIELSTDFSAPKLLSVVRADSEGKSVEFLMNFAAKCAQGATSGKT